jgi:hypothetical protein
MKKGLTHYVVLTIPGIGQNLELKDMQMRFEQIKQRYPSVVFIYLRNDAERARAEKRKFRPLSDIIMRSSRHKEKKHEIS